MTKIWTTRSGQILHATPSCPTLERAHVVSIDDKDRLPVAKLCDQPICKMVRGRKK